MNENIDHIIRTIKCCFDLRHNVVIMKDIWYHTKYEEIVLVLCDFSTALPFLLHRSKSTMLFREHYNHLSKLRYNIPCKVRAELNWCNAIWTFQTNTKLLFIVWLSAISYFHAGLIQTINNKQFQHQLLFVTSQQQGTWAEEQLYIQQTTGPKPRPNILFSILLLIRWFNPLFNKREMYQLNHWKSDRIQPTKAKN